MRIGVFGLGYVGAVSMACLARDGHDLLGIDIDETKLALIRSGRSPIVEEGIQELTKTVVDQGRVRVSHLAADAVANAELSFVCVGTPSRPNGSQDLTAIRRLSEQLGQALATHDGYHVIVIRSTVQPGTVRQEVIPLIERHSGKRHGEAFSVCFQPEFLREGTSIKDYDNPPYTIVGADHERAIALLRDLFAHLPGEFIATSIETAECVKYACNAFHALKVTFANEIGRISQSVDVDSLEVMRLVCEDKHLNISPAYLRPGFAFGGSCLPKDLRALLYVARNGDVNVPMLQALLPSNELHVAHAARMVMERGRPRVGMIGISFKSGTDDLRESPLVTLAETFIGKGLDLRIHDPEVSLAHLMGANRRYIDESIPHIGSLMSERVEDVIAHADVLVVGLNDTPLIDAVHAHHRADQFILDLVSMRDADELNAEYQGVCW
ncbi:MAG: nucleotide sugar dehydrogenase [Pseudomonadota bacterium]